MPERGERQPSASRQIAIVLTDRVELLEAAGAAQIFIQAAEEAARVGAAGDPPYRVVFLSRAGRVATSAGMSLETVPLAATEAGAFDTVIVSGCPARSAVANVETIAWLRSAAGRVRRLASTCTGAFLLAEAGFLEGRRAATH